MCHRGSVFRRRIRITKSGSQSTLAWTPWQEKDKINDLGPDEGWRRMLRVEAVNALDNLDSVLPGERHVLGVEYSAKRV